MAIDLRLVDKLLADYKKPEDLIGENGLLEQLTRCPHVATAARGDGRTWRMPRCMSSIISMTVDCGCETWQMAYTV
jgi:hypothetical protein